MVIDSSAVLAILQNEPERGAFNAAIAIADHCALSAGLMAKGIWICFSARHRSAS
jgi:ribonuclease VapC